MNKKRIEQFKKAYREINLYYYSLKYARYFYYLFYSRDFFRRVVNKLFNFSKPIEKK